MPSLTSSDSGPTKATSSRSDVVLAGIDLGGTKVRAALSSLAGNIIVEATEPTDGGGGMHVVDQMVHMLNALQKRATVRAEVLGVGSPGVVDSEGRFQFSFNIEELSDLSMEAELAKRVGIPVIVDNDVNMAALGEQWMGLGQGLRHFVVLSIGTGLGMGIVINGDLYRGAHGFAGEVAYLPIGGDPAEPRAVRFGTLELAAGSAGIREAWERAQSGESNSTNEGELADVAQIFSAVHAGNATAQHIVDEESRLIAHAVLSVAAIIDPEVVIITGGIGSDSLLLGRLVTHLDALSPHPIRVERSTLGEQCGVIGALAAARAKYLAEVSQERTGS